jgi:hypothetical protein
MADRKISDLTALTTPASGDFLPIVDISEAAAASKNKRITIEELMRGVPDGTAAAPGIAFETDPNTGIYSPGADQLAVATNGTRRLLIDSAGALTLDTGDATIYGVRVGRGASAISTNTVVGNDALTAITTGGLNTAMGGNALKGNTDGVQNTAVGYNALIANTSGNYNTAYGLNALFGNTTGSYNTCIGNPAGISLTTGSNNTIIGCVGGTAGLANTVIIAAGQTERLRIDSSGRLLVGTSTAPTASVLNTSKLVVAGNAANTGAGTITLARGSAVTVADQFAGEIFFTDSAEKYFARIAAECDGTPGTNDYPGRLVFSTTADGAATPTERMRIKSAGTINFSNVSTYADNTAALAGGLVAGDVYRKSDGTLMITY